MPIMGVGVVANQIESLDLDSTPRLAGNRTCCWRWTAVSDPAVFASDNGSHSRAPKAMFEDISGEKPRSYQPSESNPGSQRSFDKGQSTENEESEIG